MNREINTYQHLIGLLFEKTHSKRVIEEILDWIKTDEEKEKMIDYLENVIDPTSNDIRYRAIEIVSPRWGLKL